MEPLLTVTLKTLNGKHAEFAVKGEADAGTYEELRTPLLEVIDGGATDVVIDLADVTFLDSSGLRGLVEAIQRGATLTLRNLRPPVQLVFDIVEIPGLTIER
jgi:anti-sigma B factor antagonist